MTTTMSMKKNKDSYNMSNSVQYKVENNVFEIKNIVQNFLTQDNALLICHIKIKASILDF